MLDGLQSYGCVANATADDGGDYEDLFELRLAPTTTETTTTKSVLDDDGGDHEDGARLANYYSPRGRALEHLEATFSI